MAWKAPWRPRTLWPVCRARRSAEEQAASRRRRGNCRHPRPRYRVAASARTRSYKKLAARCRNKPQIVTAIGRELLGFIWAIAVHTEARAASSAAA
jgi:hypothetical protein